MHVGFESKLQETRQDVVQSLKREKHSELGKKTKIHKYSCIINLQIKTNLYWLQIHKRLKEHYLLGQKHNLQIFGVIPFIFRTEAVSLVSDFF